MVCSVDIRWYKGDQRSNNFVISISADGSSYQNVFDSKAVGTQHLSSDINSLILVLDT